ncbi:MAG TPA: hypothetical protein VFA57_09685 [Pseudolabrys sp.]|nr:hypothetical protein [Pseudolabrys sp.]
MRIPSSIGIVSIAALSFWVAAGFDSASAQGVAGTEAGVAISRAHNLADDVHDFHSNTPPQTTREDYCKKIDEAEDQLSELQKLYDRAIANRQWDLAERIANAGDDLDDELDEEFFRNGFRNPCHLVQPIVPRSGQDSGYYGWIGAQLGAGFTNYKSITVQQTTFSLNDLLSEDKSAGLRSTGVRAGLAFGVDRVMGTVPGTDKNWKLGVQADFGYFDSDEKVNRIPGSALFTPGGSGSDYLRLQTSWEGSVGPRVSVHLTPMLMLYATGGGAFQEFKATVNCGSGLCGQNGIPQATVSTATWRTGYYYGGGIIGPLTGLGDGKWRWGIEVRESDYGTWRLASGNPAQYQGTFDLKLNDLSVMVSIVHRDVLP